MTSDDPNNGGEGDYLKTGIDFFRMGLESGMVFTGLATGVYL